MPAWAVSGPMLDGLLTVGFYEKLRKILYCFKESSSKENQAFWRQWYRWHLFLIVSKLGTVRASNEQMIDTDSFEFCSHHRQWWRPSLSEIFSNGTTSHRMSFYRYSPAFCVYVDIYNNLLCLSLNLRKSAVHTRRHNRTFRWKRKWSRDPSKSLRALWVMNLSRITYQNVICFDLSFCVQIFSMSIHLFLYVNVFLFVSHLSWNNDKAWLFYTYTFS